jgi:hypothetical protein
MREGKLQTHARIKPVRAGATIKQWQSQVDEVRRHACNQVSRQMVASG